MIACFRRCCLGLLKVWDSGVDSDDGPGTVPESRALKNSAASVGVRNCFQSSLVTLFRHALAEM